MPLVKLDPSLEYFLISFDKDGAERREADSTLLSDMILSRLRDPAAGYTHVFLMSHGWKGDMPAAREQYDAWTRLAASTRGMSPAAGGLQAVFKPMIIGVHWPSLPWGEEKLEEQSASLLGRGDEEVGLWASRISDTPAALTALQTVLNAARVGALFGALPSNLREAFITLASEAGLQDGGPSDPPERDHPRFDPDATMADAISVGLVDSASRNNSLLLGGAATAPAMRDALLMPLRQLSFWKMKDRARQVGETGVRTMLAHIRSASAHLGLHLMGHSFGCIVMSAAVAGPPQARSHPTFQVDSLFLVQGAFSLWGYAQRVPYGRESGYFGRILRDSLVRGPIVTTRSVHDRAIGLVYPLGARVAGQYLLGRDLPLYGGIGTFGLQGIQVTDRKLLQVNQPYLFEPRKVYNLEASEFIRRGDGLSGAHSDIIHPEVAFAMWEAARAASPASWSEKAVEVDKSHSLQTEGFGHSAPPYFSDHSPVPGRRGLGGLLGGSPDEGGVFAPSHSAAFGTSGSSVRQSSANPYTQDRARASWLPSGGAGPLAPMSPPLPASVPAHPSLNEPTSTSPAAADPIHDVGDGGRRWVNAELEGHAPDMPLVVSRWYTLRLDIGTFMRSGTVGSVPLADIAYPDGVDVLTIEAQLDSADFETAPDTRSISLPITGPSCDAVKFGISPLHEGPCSLKVTLHRAGNFLQQLTLTFTVGGDVHPSPSVASEGRPPSAARRIQARDIGISLVPQAASYDCIAWGGVSSRATLPFSQAYLANAVDAFRSELMTVIEHRGADGMPTFQASLDIPPQDQEFALRTLSRAGALLFNNIFYGPDAGADAREIGDFLRRRLGCDGPTLKLQVVSRGTPIPWACLYVGDLATGEAPTWDKFVGMRHIVEQIPMQPGLRDDGPDMPSDKPSLVLSTNFNAGIDATMGLNLVGDQDAYWKDAAARRRVVVRRRTTREALIAALNDEGSGEQLIYLYCHATSAAPGAPKGIDGSSLVLDGAITLGDLKLDAPSRIVLKAAPLVFINACESAALSPAFYDGFVPYFMAKGARGVVGTECATPGLFARHWASAFFDEFLDGAAIGETFLKLRRSFLDRHGNPLGLLYAVHCDGDVRITPAPV